MPINLKNITGEGATNFKVTNNGSVTSSPLNPF